MNSDNDWVEDVRRWYLAGNVAANVGYANAIDGADDAVAIGYEAAHPALQARHWPDVARSITDSV